MDLIRNIIPDWPYLQWVCVYSGAQSWELDPTRAVIQEVKPDENGIVLVVNEDNRSFTTYIQFSTLSIPQPYNKESLCTALQQAIGRTLEDAGNTPLSRSD